MNSVKVASTSDRLREVMKEQHLKQVDILRMAEPYCKGYNLKFTKSTLSQYLSGRNEPDKDKLIMLANILDVSEPWLLGYDVPKERISNRLDVSDVYTLNRVLDWIKNDASQRDLIDIIAQATEMLRK